MIRGVRAVMANLIALRASVAKQVRPVVAAVVNAPSRNMEQKPSFAAQMGAVGREAVKDVRNTFHQVFFGRGESPGEPGAPMNPTPQIVTQALGGVGQYQPKTDTFSKQQKDRGIDR